MSAIKVAKASLRQEIENKLKLLTIDEKVKQSAIVREKLLNREEFKNSKHVSVFLSLENEIETEPIVRKIFADGKKCFVPRFKKGLMEMVELFSMEDWITLPVTKWNIKQPSFKDHHRRNALDEGLDLIIVPGVAFTKEGLRLGHGAGYYDKFLKLINEKQRIPPKTVAVGFKEQLVDDVPIEDTDVKIDIILYPND